MASLVAPERWRLLGQEHGLEDVGWDDPRVDLLWRYNQHYFDDLNAQGADGRREWHRTLVARWIRDNPPARGTGWAPYPASLRIVNWVKWWLGGEEPAPSWLDSLAMQARWLEQRIEWHLLGNHLFCNAKALAFAGLFFDGPEAQRWLVLGAKLLVRELDEQVLADGAHFERSPMYHALALEDVLDLLNLLDAMAPAERESTAELERSLRARAAPMLHWLRSMTHPGGTLARFNDCAEGIAPPMAEIERYGHALGIQASEPVAEALLTLRASGYLRMQRGPAVALLDAAPIGPDYLPGHAHADTLSFELSLHGREVIVNRGTSVYGDGPRRQLERGTPAHSTLEIGGRDSSEVWAGFRVGRRARVDAVAIDGWSVDASHEGYSHLPGRPRHRRRWQFESDALTVTDRVEPAAHELCTARLHFAPGLAVVDIGDGRWHVHDRGRVVACIDVITGAARIESWQHAAAFGTLVDANTLAVDGTGGCVGVRIAWKP